MNLIGEVVFCVDCDRAGSAQPSSTATDATAAVVAQQRRMATKKDTNGDALCATCLDARLRRRRAEFVLHQGGAAASAQPRVAPSPVPETTARFIPSVALRSIGATPIKPSTAIARPTRDDAAHVEVIRVAEVDYRDLERRFRETAIAVGFVRARALLDQLQTYAATLAKRPR